MLVVHVKGLHALYYMLGKLEERKERTGRGEEEGMEENENLCLVIKGKSGSKWFIWWTHYDSVWYKWFYIFREEKIEWVMFSLWTKFSIMFRCLFCFVLSTRIEYFNINPFRVRDFREVKLGKEIERWLFSPLWKKGNLKGENRVGDVFSFDQGCYFCFGACSGLSTITEYLNISSFWSLHFGWYLLERRNISKFDRGGMRRVSHYGLHTDMRNSY